MGGLVRGTWPTCRAEDSELTGAHRGVSDTLRSAARDAGMEDGCKQLGGERLHRSILAALGNSIVPQVASEIIAAIIAAENWSEEKGGAAN